MNPYTIIAALLIWAASLLGVGYKAYEEGRTTERAAWQNKENVELNNANLQILRLNRDARAQEHQHAAELAAAAAHFELERQNEITAKDTLISQLRAGTVQLRDPGTHLQASGGATTSAAASPTGSDGGAGSELSEQLAEFLINEASRADEVVVELHECQAVIVSDRTMLVPSSSP